MSNKLSIDLIINKIIIFYDYTVKDFEKYVGKLSPAGKYQIFLLNASIVIQRLKVARIFQSGNLDTDLLMEKVLIAANSKFDSLKKEHDITYNTYEHKSFIIAEEINKQNRKIFKKSRKEIFEDSVILMSVFNLEIDNRMRFIETYLNIIAYPFFSATVSQSEQAREKRTFVDLINNHSSIALENFDNVMINLINHISNKLNEDSYFMSSVSKTANKNCYIATLVYQDIDHPNVEFLRNYRDEKLLKTDLGIFFIKKYYKYSPKIVEFLKPYPTLNKKIKSTLNMIILILKKTK